ncbi:MAG TPA: FlgD immunoglobulin-like domain containing protein [Candidatus Krumholzibacteria bacterium]|nr:FlgD immunoglobulin-like domain containing protein [Candidatus Krumholzibacteria bacterium]HRX51797.1 FlgD immunoglobulin-like domain containing protein [Candidatus Krumholzibacteria bacterium]
MPTRILASILAVTALLCAAVAGAAVVTVTTGADPIDIDWQTATIADLPGPDGLVSFSEAMIATNNTPGHDTVRFEIPQNLWQLQWLYPGYATIWSSYTYFWRATDAVTIDGWSQEAFTGDAHAGEAELRFYGGTVGLSGEGSTYTGVHGGAVSVYGSNNLVVDNTGGINIDVFNGTGNEIRGNVAGTIKIDRSSFNTVAANICSRVRVWGTEALGTPGEGNVIGGPDPADGNLIVGYGSVNSEGLPAGAAIELSGVRNTLIENNRIGLDVDGLETGNTFCTMGIEFINENNDTTVRGNRIAGVLGRGQGPHHAGQLFGWAVIVSGSGSGFVFQDNIIGLNVNGEPRGSVWGVDLGTWNYFGAAGIEVTGNTISGHRINGVTVGVNVQGVRLSRNLIYGNDDLGIDLIPSGYGYGVTPNDPGDADTGGNGLQNFPEILAAGTDGGMVELTGRLDSTPGTDFTVDLFASPAAHATGYGEGEIYLGSVSTTTDGSGIATFDVVLAAAVPAGWVASATATREPDGATSEFALAQAFVPATITSSSPEATPLARAVLGRPWPNPANPRLSVELTLPRAGVHTVRVIDARGRAVATLLDGAASAGAHVLQWDGLDDTGRAAATGTYFVQLVGDAGQARRFTLLR